MAEEEERTLKEWLRVILPRILRAALWGFLMGGEMLILLFIPDIGGRFQEFFPVEQTGFSYLLFIFIGFEVAIQLLRGTIIQYVLGIVRALASMIALVFLTNGGIMTFTISSIPEIPLPPDIVISFTVGFRVVLGLFLVLSLLIIIKNLLKAINFLSEKAEEPVIPPEFP
jgi:hypothetical protein